MTLITYYLYFNQCNSNSGNYTAILQSPPMISCFRFDDSVYISVSLSHPPELQTRGEFPVFRKQGTLAFFFPPLHVYWKKNAVCQGRPRTRD